MQLLDTDVVVDVRRGHPPAVEWLLGQPGMSIALPGIVVLEVINGVRTKKELRDINRLADSFRTFWPTVPDCQRARRAHAAAKLSHGLGILDMLIAQTAIGLGATLLTFNTRHFAGVRGLATRQPYAR